MSDNDHVERLTRLFGTAHPVALVTGSGAPRVGNCIARELARRGYRQVIHANTSVDDAQQTAEELSTAQVPAISVTADLSDADAARAMIDQAREQMGRLDVLVNSAAIWSPKKLEEVTADDVRRYFEVNSVGTFVCCQHAGLIMAGQETGGAILNLGDWAVVRPYLHHGAYFPSKGAIPTLTRTMALELGHRNPRIRVNAVLPGPVMLPDDLPAEDRQAAIDATLLKREGSPQNVADAAVALIENDFITGICLPVDGGRTVYSPDATHPGVQ